MLNLSGCIPDGDAARVMMLLVRMMHVNTSLTSLDTRGNNISGDSAEQLAAAVLGSRSLLKFGGIPMKELRANKLTELDLSNQGLGPSEGRLLGGLVAVNTSLTSIDLSPNRLGTQGALALADALRVNTSLTNLNLGSTGITDMAGVALVQALTFNTSLTSLDLCDNSIGHEGVEQLAKALARTSLTSLNLSKNNILSRGGIALAGALRDEKTSLTSLNLNRVFLGPEGAVALAEALLINTSLTSLDARGNELSDAIKKTLEDVAAMRRGLDLQL